MEPDDDDEYDAPPPPTHRRLLNVKEALEILPLSRAKLYKLLAQGDSGFRSGRAVRFYEDSLLTYRDDHPA